MEAIFACPDIFSMNSTVFRICIILKENSLHSIHSIQRGVKSKNKPDNPSQSMEGWNQILHMEKIDSFSPPSIRLSPERSNHT